ncbi:MAG: hypothetical protein ACI31F_01450 [Muribaculaceae bacterium]
MKKLLNILAVLTLVSVFAVPCHAEIKNRLPKKKIVSAIQAIKQDSTATLNKPFECLPGTTSITVESACPSVLEDRPYTITVDSLGITLEIFNSAGQVYNKFFRYKGCNFEKIMAKVDSAKLKKVKKHGELLTGGTNVYLSFYNKKEKYFAVSNENGEMNYEGDFDGIIEEIKGQIPDFDSIIEQFRSDSLIEQVDDEPSDSLAV